MIHNIGLKDPGCVYSSVTLELIENALFSKQKPPTLRRLALRFLGQFLRYHRKQRTQDLESLDLFLKTEELISLRDEGIQHELLTAMSLFL